MWRNIVWDWNNMEAIVNTGEDVEAIPLKGVSRL